MEANIKTAPVRVVKNEFGNMNPAMLGALTGTELTQQISCNFRDLGIEYLLKFGKDEECTFTEAGTKTAVLDADSIATRHISLENGRQIWIVAADFDTLIEKCDSCCVS